MRGKLAYKLGNVQILDDVRREALVAPLYNLLYLGLTCPNKAVSLPKSSAGGGKPLKNTLKTQGMGLFSHQ
jgi:hypothetical protein